MSKSLSELQQSPRVGLPERTHRMCLASALTGEVQALVSELQAAEELAVAQAEGDGDKAPPRRAGQKSPADKIRKQLATLKAEVEDHTGILVVRGVSNAAWLAWVAEHPARDGNQRDVDYTYGICDADALMASLGDYAATWNGEPVSPDEWAFIENTAAPVDIKRLTQLVVSMHEMQVDIPKVLSGLLGILDDESS